MSHKSNGQKLYEDLCYKLCVPEPVPWHQLSEYTRNAYRVAAKLDPPDVIATADEIEENEQ